MPDRQDARPASSRRTMERGGSSRLFMTFRISLKKPPRSWIWKEKINTRTARDRKAVTPLKRVHRKAVRVRAAR